MTSKFTEATRVQIPAMVHLTRLGYRYVGKISEDQANDVYDADTNILLKIFQRKFKELNPGVGEEVFDEVVKTIRQDLDNDDLGKVFYNRIRQSTPYRIIDFENFENNDFCFTGEFTCRNGFDEFRPDITLFVNGLPLCFIEVKKPNNPGGMLAESRRMNEQRFPNRKFRRFVNITQLMIFSNNMEYDALSGIVPIQGAFYCTGGRSAVPFNCFREENPRNEAISPFNKEYPYKEIDLFVEARILEDFNCPEIRHTPEYKTNLDINTPTNRVLTSMCSPERFLFLLKYGIAYVKKIREVDGKLEITDQKHIMRYQQMFASLAIRDQLEKGAKAGVVWHTQGSGKTALSFYLSQVLSDFYSQQNKVAKFYFIVDRIDLMDQAKQEFEARGLKVVTANSRTELMKQFRQNQSQDGTTGDAEIIVVNIQKFAEDKERVQLPRYATNLQRVFVLDEAHRGYKPYGCFLANLFNADKNSIKIALTGTPLLKSDNASSKVFGRYFHTYYYDRSIADGYTLKIIREDIETKCKEELSSVYDKLETLIQKKDLRKELIIEHPSYVSKLAKYIERDFETFRSIQGDESLGGMVVCETSGQAKKLYDYLKKAKGLTTKLVLYDTVNKEQQKNILNSFKNNMTVDLLIVYNMLLTGFDSPRLKRLYLARKLKDHNLLQALTRVNRPYNGMRYGFVVDFADIKKNFQETNEAYLRELSRYNNPNEVDDDQLTNTYLQVIEDPEVLIGKMQDVRQTLFEYTTENLEEFCSEISEIEDKKHLFKLKEALLTAKDCVNIVRTFGDDELKAEFTKIEFKNLPLMLREVLHRINIVNQKECFSALDDKAHLINEAMQDIQFSFAKIGEEELKMIDNINEIQQKWSKVIRAFTENTDPDDPEYITLREAFSARFKELGFNVNSAERYDLVVKELTAILDRLNNIQKKNNRLLKLYNGDSKFANLHKRINEENLCRNKKNENPLLSFHDEQIVKALRIIKKGIDQHIYKKADILKQDDYFEKVVLSEIASTLQSLPHSNNKIEDYYFIQHRLATQYLNQYKKNFLS